MIKLKQLESRLQKLSGFEEPNVKYEQYPTTPHIASQMLYTIQTVFGDIQDKVVLDLGVGCGILTIGSSMLGSASNIGIDIDPSAIEIARKNLNSLEIEDVQLIQCDVQKLVYKEGKIFEMGKEEPLITLEKPIDVIIMNPPFGTKNQGIDMIFLQKAFELASTSVYSLHKTATRKHVLRKAQEWGANAQVVAELCFNISAMYKFHKKQTQDIEVDFIRFDVSTRPKAN